MRGPTWEDVGGGVGSRVTVLVMMGSDEAAHELAPHLSALTGKRVPASSGEADARPGVPVVTISGYSGPGKSTLVVTLAQPVNGWQVLHLDDWCPGWDGLAEGVHVARRIAVDLRGERASSYEAWDWENGRTGVTISVPLAPTIIEGYNAIDAEANLSVWIVDPGEDGRRSRALARDRQTYASHWQQWTNQDLGRSPSQVYAAATSRTAAMGVAPLWGF